MLLALLVSLNLSAQMPVKISGASIDTSGFYETYRGPVGPQGAKGDKGDPGTSTGAAVGRAVGTWNELVLAFADMDRGLIRTINIYQSFTAGVNDSARIPSLVTFNGIINGGSYQISTTGKKSLFYREFANVTDAGKYIDFQLHVFELFLSGDGTGNGFRLSSTYQSHFQYCRFNNFKTAIDARFCLQGSVRDCRFANNYIGINADYDRFVGGGSDDSQSNAFTIESNCFRTFPGAYASIVCTAENMIYIARNIWEGGDKKTHIGSDYAVYINEAGSNTAKFSRLEDNYSEFVPGKSLFYYRVKTGRHINTGTMVHYACNVITMDGQGAYPKLTVSDWPYWPAGCTVENLNSGTGPRFDFENNPSECNPDTVLVWKNGTKPGQMKLQWWNPNSQTPEIKLNGKKVLTQTQ